VYVYGLSENNYKITKSEISATYTWYVAIPNSKSDTTSAVFFEIQHNVISAIEVGMELVDFFIHLIDFLKNMDLQIIKDL
jgi:hypothetical protein